MTPLKSSSPNMMRRHASGLFVPSKISSGSAAYVARRLARSPLGGSLVILTPFCSTETGNLAEGIEVSHSRKEGSVLLGSMPSTSRSSCGIHETKRWQFMSSTHRPPSLPPLMSASALGPCPCPSEM